MILKNNSTLIFLGDSVTDCGRSPDGELNLGSGYVNLFSSMFRIAYPETGVRFINRGVSGDQTRQVLARLERDVLSIHPDVVTLLIGVNDVWRFFDRPFAYQGVPAEEYRDNLKKIIEPILAGGAKMLVMTPYMIDRSPYEPMRTKMLEYAAICKDTAQTYGVEVLELQPVFENLLAKGITSYELSGDRIHPSQKGHFAITMALMEHLRPETE